MKSKLKALFQLFNSIRFKLSVYFLVPVIFIIILGIIAYSNASNAIITTFTKANITSFNARGDYYDAILTNLEDKAIQLTNDETADFLFSKHYSSDVIQELEAYDTVNKRVRNIAISDRYIDNIVILPSYGNPITSSGLFDGTINPYEEFSSSEEGTLINKSDNISFWSGYHKTLDTMLKKDQNAYAITLTTKFINKSLKQIGYVMIDLKTEIITETLNSLELPGQSIAAFIAPDGREISADGTSVNHLFYNKSHYDEAVKNEMAQGNSYIDYNGKKYLFIYSKVGESGAMLCAMIPYDTLTSSANSIKFLTFIIVIIASIVAATMGILVASNIGKSIKNIINKLSLAAEGDLTITVTTKRKDEFLILSNSINNMIKNMRQLIAKASEVGNSVINSSDYVINNSELLLTASKDISAAIDNIQSGIIQQVDDTEKSLKLTNDLTDKINVVHKNSFVIEKIAAEAKDVVKNGIKKVDQLNDATKASIIKTNDTINDIEELATELGAINEIVNVMNGIAEQTNLLSLNASIEAARAGSYGRGFAVVAEEIGKLSKSSVASSSEINDIVNNIKKKTYQTVTTVKQSEVISRTTENSLSTVVELFNTINIHVDDLIKELNKIVEGLSDIENAKIETLYAMENISAVAENNSASSQEVDATAYQQLEAVMKLNEVAKILHNDAADLRNSIQSFKLTK